MIGFLRGVVRERTGARILLDVAGVGYLVHVPASTVVDVPGEGREAEFLVSLQVREDSLTLYGFATQGERDVFERLLSASGVGPRTALAALSTLGAGGVAAAIREGDAKVLASVPGIGRKTAERILVELRDRMEGIAAGGRSAPRGGAKAPSDDAVSALVNLGYPERRARQVVEEALHGAKGRAVPFEDLLRTALKALGRA